MYKENITKGDCYYVEHNWEETSIYSKDGDNDQLIGTLKIDSSVNEENQHLLETIVEANAKLITEAFNVTNESGFTPLELLEQRDELLRICERFVQKVDLGQARSKESYFQMKEAIEKIKQ